MNGIHGEVPVVITTLFCAMGHPGRRFTSVCSLLFHKFILNVVNNQILIFTGIKFEPFLNSTHFEILTGYNIANVINRIYHPSSVLGSVNVQQSIASKKNYTNSFLRKILVFHKNLDR